MLNECEKWEHCLDKNGGKVKSSAAPLHVASLSYTRTLTTVCGRQIAVWDLGVRLDDKLVSDWARHFRQSYCADTDIDQLRGELSREAYLMTMVFPHPSQKPGPSIRSGDFAELLISDFLEYVQGFWVPRYKYSDKASPNESVKGSDVLGFRQSQPGVASLQDVLIVCEVKAQFTGRKYNSRLKTAVTDSSKDIGHLRLATSLNALKRRAFIGNLQDKVELVTRFQKKTDAQFILKSSAAAVLEEGLFDAVSVADVDCSTHANAQNLELLVFKGEQLMQLVHKLYEVAASEA
jgi:hypothetical protein